MVPVGHRRVDVALHRVAEHLARRHHLLLFTKYGNIKFGGDRRRARVQQAPVVRHDVHLRRGRRPLLLRRRRAHVALPRLGRRALDGSGHERQREGEPRAHADVLPLGHPRLDPLRADRLAAGHHVLPPRAPDDDALVLLPALGQADPGLARRRRRHPLDHVHALRRLHVARPRRAPAQQRPRPPRPRHVHGQRLLRH